jgi:hypothetical protein
MYTCNAFLQRLKTFCAARNWHFRAEPSRLIYDPWGYKTHPSISTYREVCNRNGRDHGKDTALRMLSSVSKTSTIKLVKIALSVAMPELNYVLNTYAAIRQTTRTVFVGAVVQKVLLAAERTVSTRLSIGSARETIH